MAIRPLLFRFDWWLCPRIAARGLLMVGVRSYGYEVRQIQDIQWRDADPYCTWAVDVRSNRGA